MRLLSRKTVSGEPQLIRHKALLPFRDKAAIFSDGRMLVVKGRQNFAPLREAVTTLQRRKVIPRKLRREIVSPDVIAAHWFEASRAETIAVSRDVLDRTRGLLQLAAAARASDLVLQRSQSRTDVFAIVNDRKLRLGDPLTAEEGAQVMGYLFHSKEQGSAQTSYQRQSFQGFALRSGGSAPLPETVAALRCQRGPHEPASDHLVARLFYRDSLAEGTTLETLGFPDHVSKTFAEIRATLHGGIFLGGSTGDGKSTTLATNLMMQQDEHGGHLNVVTVEDPVEYSIPGAMQIAVPTTDSGEDRNENFNKALMHFCRVHPACGMVSEIRDGDAARQVLQFVDTGHQVWTTIHVHSANAILFRLLDLGVSTAEVCKPGNIKLLMKQTLLPSLCPDCKRDTPPEPLPPWLLRHLEGAPLRFRNPEGCATCAREDELSHQAWAGFSGPSAVCEIIRPDSGYLAFVRDRDAGGAWDYWVSRLGGVPLSDSIWRMVRAGHVDPADALRKGAKIETPSTARLEVIEGGAER